MKPFSTHRTRRYTAFAVMLVWLFAVASGMANACLLKASATHAHAAGDAHADALASPLTVAGQTAGVGDHDGDAHAARESCLKNCDDGSNAQLKSQVASGAPDPGVAPLVATLWLASTPMVPMSFNGDGFQHAIAGPPLRVRYARLTL